MTDLVTDFRIKLDGFFTEKLPRKIAVAISGGSDSMALTILLQKFCLEKKIKLSAITINHNMRESSTIEASQLHQILRKKKITHEILEIDPKKIPTSNIEARLREARYELLYQSCIKQKIEFLFLGHQLDDVAENFLIRLFRGSGLDGLSSMQELASFKKIKLARPLLNSSKIELQRFLFDQNVEWFEDESNLDEKFLRNKIRNFLDTIPDKNLIQKRIKNTSDELTKIRDSFDEILLSEARKILEFSETGYFLIDLTKIKKIDEKIALKILALVLLEISGQVYKPRLEKLRRFYEWMITDLAHKPKTFYGCIIEKYDSKRLAIYREKRAIDQNDVKLFDKKNYLFDGRILVEVNAKNAEHLFFPNQCQARAIKTYCEASKNPKIMKKIFATCLCKIKEESVTVVPHRFYFRTILKSAANFL